MPHKIMISPETLRAIHEHVEHARKKHPWPGMKDCLNSSGVAMLSPAEKYRIAERELHEMGIAFLKGDARGVEKESLDCIAVLVRIVEGDG